MRSIQDKNKSKEKEINKTHAMIRALDNTGMSMFMYYPQTATVRIPEKTCEIYHCRPVYENMPDSFADDYVHEDDRDAFKEMYGRIERGEPVATADFHSINLQFCNHVTLTTVSWTEDGRPEEAFGIIEDMSDLYKNKKFVKQLQDELALYNSDDDTEEALKIMASAISSQYFGVYYLWLDRHTFVCFQEQHEGVLTCIGEKGDFETGWKKYIENYVEEGSTTGFYDFVDMSTLSERMGQKSSLNYDYRRKKVGWSRGQFIAGKRDEKGRLLTVIFTVSDINEEMENKQKKIEAEKEALRDPLTKLWNRQAFARYKTDMDYSDNPAGLLLFDIDRFKGINDQYGHSEGDKVLIAVSQAIRGVLREKDLIFRMGGDELAVLLYNCHASVWHTVCRKIEAVHEDIRKALPEEMNVTISGGLCVNESGYCDEMYELADRALYNTKAKGRAGCTFVGMNGEIISQWHDNSGFIRKGDVLEKNSTVTWRLDKPKKEGMRHKAYGDEMFYAFAGLDSSAAPEELFQAWADRVEPDNFDIIEEAIRLAIADGNVEVVFAWKHPEKGVVKLRCSASFESETDEYYTFIGYIHIITGTHVVTMEDIDVKVKNALEEMYFSNYYVRLKDYSFKVYKAQPYMLSTIKKYDSAIDAIDHYVQNMVAEGSRELMSSFLDLTTLSERMKNINYIGVDYEDLYIGWARAKLIAVSRDDRGEVETASFVVESIR